MLQGSKRIKSRVNEGSKMTIKKGTGARGINTLKQVSTRLGYSTNWLSSMKHNCPEKFEYLLGFNEDRYKSLIKAEEHIESLQREVEDIYFRFDKASEFHEWCHGHNILNSKTTKQADYYAIDRVLFFAIKGPLSRSLGTIRRLEKITTAWNKDGNS